MAKRILIQGFEGSFHQMAAQHFWGNEKINLKFCKSFKMVFDEMQKTKKYDAAIVAIENSIAGSILNNYTLLNNSVLNIIGEVYLKIKQQFIVNPWVTLEDIREVHSHPIALLQCVDFLSQYDWKLVETEDTALSVQHIKQNQSSHIAGIAGVFASNLFKMKILRKDINSVKDNVTRFLVLAHHQIRLKEKKINKASIQFEVNHKSGSLAQVLMRIHYHNINLTKIQSGPLPQKRWNYFFHLDMEFDNIKRFYDAIEDIRLVTQNIKIFGVYEKGKMF